MTRRVSRKKLALILTCCFVLIAVTSALIGTLAINSGAYAAGENVVLTGSVSVSGGGTSEGADKPMVITDLDTSATITVTYNLTKGTGANTLAGLYVKLAYDSDLFELKTLTAKNIGSLTYEITNDLTAEDIYVLWEGNPASFSSVSGVLVATYQLRSDATFSAGEHTFGLTIEDCYTMTAGDSLSWTDLSNSVNAAGTKIVTKKAGTITIAANQSLSYNGKTLKAADATASPSDAATENYIRYTYNGYGQTGAGDITVKWYKSSGEELTEAPTNVGTYKIGVSAAAGDGYTAVAEVQQTITIAPQYLNYAATDITVVNGEKPSDSATWVAADFTAPAHTTVTAVGTPSGTLGDVTVPVTLTADNNYTLTEGGENGGTRQFNVSVKIIAADNGFTSDGALSVEDKIYDGTAATVSATVKYGDSGKTFKYQKKTGADAWSDLSSAPTDAGTYQVRVEVAAGTGYNAFTSDYVQYTIGKAQVLIDEAAITSAWIAANVTLPNREYTGSAQTFAASDITMPDALAEIADASAAAVDGDAQTTVGSHSQTVTLTLKSSVSNNYTFGAAGTDVASVSGTVSYQITKRTVQVPTIEDIEYNGQSHSPSSSNTDYTYSVANAQTNAGSYTLTATLADESTTKWASGDEASITVNWKIAPKKITVTLPDGSMQYSSTFDPTAHINDEDLVISTLVSGENFDDYWKYVVKTSDGSAVTDETTVGTYVVGMEWKDDVSHNYEITTLNEGVFEVTQKVIAKSSITVAEVTSGVSRKEYSGSAYTWAEGDFSIKIGNTDVSNLVELKAPEGGIIDANGTLADGTFTYYTENDNDIKYYLALSLKDSTNYKFDDSTNNGKEIQIYKAEVKVITDGYATMAPEDSVPTVTKPVLNVVSANEIQYTIYTDGTMETEITSGFQKGETYTVNFTVEDTKNHGAWSQPTTFMIDLVGVDKPAIVVEATTEYNGSAPSITIGGTAIGSVSSEAYTAYVVEDETGATDHVAYVDVGAYKVVVELKPGYYWKNTEDENDKNDNKPITQTFEITPVALTLTLSLADGAAATIKEGEAAPGYKVVAEGFIDGESATSLGITSWANFVLCIDSDGDEYSTSSKAGEYSYAWKKTDGMNPDIQKATQLKNYTVAATVSDNTFTVEALISAAGFIGYKGTYDGEPHPLVDMTNGDVSVESDAGYYVYYAKADGVTSASKIESWDQLLGYFYGAGDYELEDITVTDVSDNDKYFLKFVDMNDDAIYCYATITVQIDPADNTWETELTVSNMAYNGGAPVEGDGNNYFAEATENNDNLSYKFYSNADCSTEIELEDIIDAGDYWVKAVVPATGNYNALESEAKKITITPAIITVTLDLSYEKEYDGNAVAFPNEITATDASGGMVTMNVEGTAPRNVNRDASKNVIPHDITLSFTWSGVTSNTDNYVIKVKDSGNGNNIVSADENGKFTAKYTINPVAVTVTADDKSSVCGEDLVALTSQITSGALVGSEELALTLSTNANKNTVSADYVITIAVDDATVNNNYNITTVAGKYEVTAIQNVVTLTINDTGLTYMDSITSGSTSASVCQTSATSGEPSLQYRKSETDAWQTFAELKNGAGFLDAGTWQVKAVVAASGNYAAGESEVKTMTIAKATLSTPTFSYNGDVVSWSEVTTTTNSKNISSDTLVKVIYKFDQTGVEAIDGSTTSFKAVGAAASGFSVEVAVVLVANETTASGNYNVLDLTTAAAYSVSFTSTDSAVQGASEMPATVYVFSGEKVSAPTAPTATSHTFDKWMSGSSEFDFANTAITANTTLTASWNIKTYTITWKLSEDEVTPYTTTVNHGQTPAYDKSTPTKAEDASYTYTFAGWDPELVAATEDATYVAKFTATAKSKTVTFMVTDGKGASTKLDEVTLNVGAALAPSKTPEAHAYFMFKGWYTNEGMTTLAPATVPAQDGATMTVYGKYVLDVGTGDVNGDQSINVDDVTLYRRYLVGGYLQEETYKITVVENDSAAWDIDTSKTDKFFFKSAASYLGGSNPAREISVIRVALLGTYGVKVVSGYNVTGAEIVSSETVVPQQLEESEAAVQAVSEVVNNSAKAENVAMLPVIDTKRRQSDSIDVA